MNPSRIVHLKYCSHAVLKVNRFSVLLCLGSVVFPEAPENGACQSRAGSPRGIQV